MVCDVACACCSDVVAPLRIYRTAYGYGHWGAGRVTNALYSILLIPRIVQIQPDMLITLSETPTMSIEFPDSVIVLGMCRAALLTVPVIQVFLRAAGARTLQFIHNSLGLYP